MAVTKISAKSFLEAMKLPDTQRRKVLETLGEKLMSQLQVEEPVLNLRESAS